MESSFTNLGTVLEGYSKKITEALKKNLENHDSIASHKLWQSIQFPVTIFGTKYTATLKMEDYWKYVDEGRKPGKMPPTAPLVKWISQKAIDARTILLGIEARRKGMSIGRRNKSIKQRSRDMSALSAAKSLAYIIAKKIEKKGIEPTNFYSDVWTDKLKADIQRDVSIATNKDIAIEIKSYIDIMKNIKK